MEQESKQVIVVRKDLNMRKGKLAAQVAHASMKVFLDQATHYHGILAVPCFVNSPVHHWLTGRFTKVVVSVDSEQQLLDLIIPCMQEAVLHALVTDAGLTEFHGVPTNTCLAVGPDWSSTIDRITGHLKLL